MNDKTLVALYHDRSDAMRALDELDRAGITRHHFRLLGPDSGERESGTSGGDWAGSAVGSGSPTGAETTGYRSGETAGSGYDPSSYDPDAGTRSWSSVGTDFWSRGNRVSSLTRLGVPESDAHAYSEGVRRGGTLLIGRLSGDIADQALAIIEQNNPADIDRLRSDYEQSGWSRYDEDSTDYDETLATQERGRYGSGLGAAAMAMRDSNVSGTGTTGTDTTRGVGTGEEVRIPVAEENVQVGKREVEGGGIRVRSYVVETPVEQDVRLRDERVTVERNEVAPDRPASEADFREQAFEVSETREEAVVSKDARVTEEVVVRKESDERTERVADTARRTEVDVDRPTDRTDDPGRGDIDDTGRRNLDDTDRRDL